MKPHEQSAKLEIEETQNELSSREPSGEYKVSKFCCVYEKLKWLLMHDGYKFYFFNFLTDTKIEVIISTSR